MFKARVVPVNVNYRYVEHELLYLLDNSDAEALAFDAQLADEAARKANQDFVVQPIAPLAVDQYA